MTDSFTTVSARSCEEIVINKSRFIGYAAPCADEQEALPHLAEAEVILGQSAALAENAPRLRWLCTPSAGVNQFTPGCFANPEAVLTNSSGAYGVTRSFPPVAAPTETPCTVRPRPSR